MKKRKLLFTMLALGLGAFLGGSGAMAQNGWEAIYTQTQTTSDDWNPLASDQTEGYTLGATGTTKYYYLKKSLNFTNSTAGGSGLTIKGTVYLYIPYGLTITCVGADASGATGAGAGIELAEGNTLYIIGSGDGVHTTVTATGGNAANGSNGAKGEDASFVYNTWIRTGAGGKGGDGGGGAGAGIGSRGGAGGVGGAGGAAQQPNYESHTDGTSGTDGTAGATAGNMGTLYVDQTFGITMEVTGGSGATTGGSGGARGTCAVEDSASNNYSMAGGGGGGGGGFGGAASNVGTGGPGGGGGGGGAGGTQERTNSGYLVVFAPGGRAGKNADGSNAEDGKDAYIYGDWKQGSLISNSTWSESAWDDDHDATTGIPGFGSGCGYASSNGTTNAGKKEYNITYNPLKTYVNGSNSNPVTVTYSPSGATNVVLPQNNDGYQWVLLTYGKSCAPNGTPDSQFATNTKNYFGGHVSEAERTIILSNVYGDLLFQEIATLCSIENSGNNDQDIAEFQEAQYPITVRLKNRTLYRDNHWNTICLPFNLTAEQYNSVSCPLAGATIFKMDESTTGYYPNGVENSVMHINYTSPTLLFWFENANPSTNGLQAGKPYLVKWTEGNQFTADGNYVDNTEDSDEDPTITPRHELDFENVSIALSSPSNWTSHANTYGNVVFQGTFSSSATIYAGDKTRLMLGADDKLYYPSKNINVSACRGYFIIPSEAANARGIVMGFDDGETTSIQTINVTPNSQQDAPVYNLNGQRLSAPQKGINIVNGKKVIIK